jgi:hypothetical protein
MNTQQVAAYRYCIDNDIYDPDDIYPYTMSGQTGLAHLVHLYETQAGLLTSTAQWPTTEAAMLHLQLQDPTLKAIIENLTETQPTHSSYGRIYYQPRLYNQQKGALRVRWQASVDERIADLFPPQTPNRPPHQPAFIAKKRARDAVSTLTEQRRVEVRTLAEDDTNLQQRDRDTVRHSREALEELDTPWEEEPQTVLPESLRLMAIKFFHDSQGHPGIKRTLATMHTKYYWRHMSKDIKQHIECCTRCNRRKSDSATHSTPPVLHQPIPTRPMQRVHTDLITNLTKTRSGNIHISTTVCALTGYLSATALPDKEATTVNAQHLLVAQQLVFAHFHDQQEVIHQEHG